MGTLNNTNNTRTAYHANTPNKPKISSVETNLVTTRNRRTVNRSCPPDSPSVTTAAASVPQIEQNVVNSSKIIKNRYLLSSSESESSSNSPSLLKCVDIHTGKNYLCKIIHQSYDKVQLAYFRISNANDYSDDNNRLQFSNLGGNWENFQLIRPVHDVHPCGPIERNQTYLIVNPVDELIDLHTHVRNKRRLSEPEAKGIFRQMCEMVKICHRNGIILRDLKLRKFFFLNYDKSSLQYESLEGAVILDDASDDNLTEKIGCPLYVAPEIITHCTSYRGKPADVWALGVLLYTMLVGQYPFNNSNGQILFTKIISCEFNIPHGLTYEVRCLILSLLRKCPEERLTVEDICYHPWFRKKTSSVNHPCNDASLLANNLDDQVVPEFVIIEDFSSEKTNKINLR